MNILNRNKTPSLLVIMLSFSMLFSGCTRVNSTTAGLSATPTQEILITPTPSVALTSPAEPSPTSTPLPTEIPTEVPTATVTLNPTATPAPEATVTSTPKPTTTPKVTITVTPKPTATATPKPTSTPTPKATPTNIPSPQPTPKPTATVTMKPTAAPTVTPKLMDQLTILTGGNGDITDVLRGAPKECVLVITVVCYEVMDSVWANWGIGGISIDGSWSVDGNFQSTIKHNPVLDEVLVFKFDIDKIRDNATGDIQINYYNGYRVLTAVIGSKYDTYKLPTPTPTPSPTPMPTAIPTRVVGPDDVEINDINFPGEAFREYVKKSVDKDKDGYLDLYEQQAVYEIRTNNMSGDLANLKGIEFFPNLVDLYCPHRGLTSLDVSKNIYLRSLDCSENPLGSLNLEANINLEVLECNNIGLTSLDLSKNKKLKTVHCTQNLIKQLDVSHLDKLEACGCWGNRSCHLIMSLQYHETYYGSVTVSVPNDATVTIKQVTPLAEDATYHWSYRGSGMRENGEFESDSSTTSQLTFVATFALHQKTISCLVKLSKDSKAQSGDFLHLYVY